MKQTIKLSLLALIMAPLFFITSCEENLQTSCDDFSISIDYEINDSTSVTLTAVPEGGEPEITYLWNNGDISQSIVVTEFDTYSVIATDGNGCTASIDFTVTPDTTNTPCAGFNATITEDVGSNSSYLNAEANGGTGPYTYEWSTNEVGQFIEVDIPGDYTVTITDAEGCVSTSTYTYVQGGGLCDYEVSIQLVSNPASGDTSLYVVIDSAGVGPFTYEWNTGDDTESIIVTQFGIYTVTVTDANGCVFTLTYLYEGSVGCNNFDVNIAVYPDSTSTLVSLSADATGGEFPYTYMWSNGELTPVIAVEENTGSYTVTVTDASGCEEEDTVQI